MNAASVLKETDSLKFIRISLLLRNHNVQVTEEFCFLNFAGDKIDRKVERGTK